MATATVGTLRAILTADTAEFTKAMSEATKDVQELGKKLQNDLEPRQRAVNAAVRDFLGGPEIRRAQEYVAAVEKIGGATKLTASDQEKVNKALSGALDHYEKLGQKAPKAMTDLRDATVSVEKPMSVVDQIAGFLGPKLIAAFSVGAILSFGKSLLDAAGHIDDMSKKLGVSTSAVQRWEHAANLTGATLDNVGAAVTSMSRQLAGGGASVDRALAAVGLEFEHIRAMSPEAAFEAIAEAIKDIPDPMEQARVAMELFGRQGAELLPAIRDGFVEVGRQAKVMSAETIQAFDMMSDAWDIFSGYFKATIAERLTQPFREMMLEWRVWKGDVGEFLKVDGKPIQILGTELFTRTVPALTLTGDALEDAAKKQERMNAETERAVTATAKATAEYQKELQTWKNRLILLEAIDYWNKQVQRSEDQKRMGYFQSRVAVMDLTAAEQANFRHNALALFQRGDQILALEDYSAALVDNAYRQSVATAETREATEVLSKQPGIFKTVADAFTGGFTQILTGAQSFKDGVISIFESIWTQLLGDFINRFIGGMLNAIKGMDGPWKAAFSGVLGDGGFFGGLGKISGDAWASAFTFAGYAALAALAAYAIYKWGPALARALQKGVGGIVEGIGDVIFGGGDRGTGPQERVIDPETGKIIYDQNDPNNPFPGGFDPGNPPEPNTGFELTGGLDYGNYQHGGVITRPTLALLGETGPELVMPLTGGGAMEGLGAGSQHGANMTVIFELDGRQLAEGIFPYTPGVAVRHRVAR